MEKSENVLLYLEKITKEYGDKNALGIKSNLGWRELTFKGLSILSQRLASYLIEKGIDKGDKITILSESKPEWGAALFASVLAGATLIPLDIKLTAYELNSILSSCMRASIPLATPGRLRRSAPSMLAAARRRWRESVWWNLPGASPCSVSPLSLLARPILSR